MTTTATVNNTHICELKILHTQAKFMYDVNQTTQEYTNNSTNQLLDIIRLRMSQSPDAFMFNPDTLVKTTNETLIAALQSHNAFAYEYMNHLSATYVAHQTALAAVEYTDILDSIHQLYSDIARSEKCAIRFQAAVEVLFILNATPQIGTPLPLAQRMSIFKLIATHFSDELIMSFTGNSCTGTNKSPVPRHHIYTP